MKIKKNILKKVLLMCQINNECGKKMNSPQTVRGECCAKPSVSKNIKQYLLLGICFFGTIFTIRAQIYDCFLFYNELELLTIRLHELYDHVDKFVLVESEETFRGNPKPLYYQENKHLFEKFADKIIHVIVKGHYQAKNPKEYWQAWEREAFQRDQIMRGLIDCDDKDIIIISDVDEILRPQSIGRIQTMLHEMPAAVNSKCITCIHVLYRYFFNRLSTKFIPNYGAMAVYYFEVKKYSPQYFRNIRTNRPFKIVNAGWHFTSMGGIDAIVSKLSAYAASHLDTPENRDWELLKKEINEMPLVPIDETFPRHIYENQEYYRSKGFIDAL